MNRKSRLNSLLVGSDWIDSRIDYKQALLRGQLAVLLGSVSFFYIVIDTTYGLYNYVGIYLATIFIAAISFYLNRIHKTQLATFILLLSTNIIVFLVADASSVDSGVFFFFTVMAIVALALFYNSNLKAGAGFVLLTILLGIIAYFNDNSILAHTELEGSSKVINYTINYVLGVVTTILVFLFVLKRNKESEDSLMGNKVRLEKLTDELQQKNAELQKANDELDRFVYSASHDMQAPLSTLLGLIQVAKISNDPKEYEQYFDMMTNRIHDMEAFIKEVTDYSRNTRLEIKYEEINLKEMLEQLQESFGFLAKEVAVRFDILVDNSLTVITDYTRLNIVLNNLIANAIKYHDHSKQDKFVKVHASTTNDLCIISIEDNGMGIATEYQPKIFDMFYRATESSKGSGLGLYIVKETLEKIGGKIKMNSNVGKGSTFMVELNHTILPKA